MKGKKTGGRKKGSPNKITSLAKDMMRQWLEAHNTTPDGDHVSLMMQDFVSLDPRDRIKVSAEFIKIIMPKNINIDDTASQITIEERLRQLSDENEH